MFIRFKKCEWVNVYDAYVVEIRRTAANKCLLFVRWPADANGPISPGEFEFETEKLAEEAAEKLLKG